MQLRLLTIVVCLLLSPSLSLAGPPAAIPEDDSHQRTLRSFKSFASDWMGKMERVETHNRTSPQVRPQGARNLITYKGYGSDFKIEIKHTGYARAPFVGVLRYSEQLFTCVDERATRCRVASTTPVTEIFRFQDGRWVY
jgi:hypothetical protein